MSSSFMTRGPLPGPRRRENDGLEGHATIGTEFAAQALRQGVNDSIGINTTAFSDLVDERIAINQPAREHFHVWDFLFQPDDLNLDVCEASLQQGFLDRINLMIGKRHLVELRRISREEA